MWPYIMVINLWRTFYRFKWKDTCGCKGLFPVSPQERETHPGSFSPRFHVSGEGLFLPLSSLAPFILFFWCCSLFFELLKCFFPSGCKCCLCCAFSPAVIFLLWLVLCEVVVLIYREQIKLWHRSVLTYVILMVVKTDGLWKRG